MYFPDRGCVRTLRTLHGYVTVVVVPTRAVLISSQPVSEQRAECWEPETALLGCVCQGDTAAGYCLSLYSADSTHACSCSLRTICSALM